MADVRLTASRFPSDAQSLNSVAVSLDNAANTALSSLAGTGGMAGDDPTAEVFVGDGADEANYDKRAGNLIDGVRMTADLVRMLDAIVVNTGRAYDNAQYAGTPEGGESPIAEAKPSITQNKGARIESAFGAGSDEMLRNNLGPFGDIAEAVLDKLREWGIVFPVADRGELVQAKSAWDALSGSLTSASSTLSGDLAGVETMEFPQRSSMTKARGDIVAYIDVLADEAEALGQLCQGLIDGIDDTWQALGGFFAQMAAEILLELGLSAVIGFFTAGLGVAAGLAKVAATITKWAIKIAEKCKWLASLMRTVASGLVRNAHRIDGLVKEVIKDAGGAAGASFTVNVSVQAIENGGFQDIDWSEAAAAAGGAAAGAGAGRLLTGGMTEAARRGLPGNPNINGTRTGRMGTGAVSGGFDGFVSATVEGALGNDVNTEAAIGLGAILGGAFGAIGGGKGPSTPPPGGPGGPGGPGLPNTGGMPGSLGGSAGSAGSGGSGGVNVGDNGAPTPGGGGSGNANAGGGNPVDVSDNSPTPGGGDAGGTGGDAGGGVELPGAEAPSGEAPSGEAPSVEAPSGESPSGETPGAEAPSTEAPAGEAPSAEAPSGESPSTEAPTAESPSTEAPTAESPSTEAPTAETPSTEAPAGEAPSAEAPTAETPLTEAPAGEAPSAEAPAGEAPSGEAPGAEAPTAEAPSAEALSVDVPDVEAPRTSAEAPVAAAPSGGSSAAGPKADVDIDLGSVEAGIGNVRTSVEADATAGTEAPEGESPSVEAPGVEAPAASAPAAPAEAPADGTAPDASTTDPTGADATDAGNPLDAVAPEAAAGATAAASVAVAPKLVPPRGGATPPTTNAPAADAPTTDPAGRYAGTPLDPNGPESGPGWQREADAPNTDPGYGQPRQDSGKLDPESGWSAQNPKPDFDDITPALRDLPDIRDGYDPNDYGTDPVTGERLDQDGFEERYVDADGNLRYPPNAGAVPGSIVTFDSTAAFREHFPDVRLDRIGGDGRYFSLEGTPFRDRALPPGNLRDPYSVLDLNDLPPGIRIEVSVIDQGFGQPGGGVQIRFIDAANPRSNGDPNALPQSELIRRGILSNADSASGRSSVPSSPGSTPSAPSTSPDAASPSNGAPKPANPPAFTPSSSAGSPSAPPASAPPSAPSAPGTDAGPRGVNPPAPQLGQPAGAGPVGAGPAPAPDAIPASGTDAPTTAEPPAVGDDPSQTDPNSDQAPESSEHDASQTEPGDDMNADHADGELSETDGTPAKDDSAPSKKVPATMHHPVLDAHFPRLEQPETIDASVETVNADGWAADTGRYGNNCHYVVNALELRARGYDVVASPTVHSLRYDPNTGQPIDGFEGRYTEAISQDWLQPDGSPPSFDSLGDFAGTRAEALDAATKDWPVGARGFISGAWKNGGAHIFSVVKTESGVRLVDGQVADGDVSGYLDEMHFGPELPATHKSWDIQIMRVDDLVPTEDVVHAAHPNTPAERKLTEAWGRAGDGTGHFADSLALPEKRIRQELAANDRWQARNDQLIARYQAIEADPSRSDAERARARDWAAILAEQNEALERGRMQFLEELADASTNRPGLNRIGVGGLMLTEEEQERIAGIVERGPGSGGQ